MQGLFGGMRYTIQCSVMSSLSSIMLCVYAHMWQCRQKKMRQLESSKTDSNSGTLILQSHSWLWYYGGKFMQYADARSETIAAR